MKLISKIVGATLGLALAVGVGYGVANRKATGLNADAVGVSFTAGSNAVEVKVNYNSAGVPSSNNGVRVGTSKNAGSATFSIPSGATKFGFYAVGWTGTSTTASVSASVGTLVSSTASLTANSNATGTINAGDTVAITETEANTKKEFSISGVTASSTITLTTSGSNRRLIAWNPYYEIGGEEPPETTPMDAPVISLSGTIVSWTNVEGNNGYSYSITGDSTKNGDLAANTTSLDVSTLSLGYGNFSITVVTKGNGTTTSNSVPSNAQAFILSEPIFSGTFNKFTGEFTEGDYIFTYGTVAMGNVVSSSKIQNSSLSFAEGAASITDPVEGVVYRAESVDVSGTTYWTLKNIAADKYVQGAASSANMTLSATAANDTNKYKVSKSNNAYNFLCKASEGETNKRYIRAYNNVWGSYISSNGGPITLYRKVINATAISLDNDELLLGVGSHANLVATLTPSNADSSITWSSSDETVAKVNQSGVVTGVAAGTATITARVSEQVYAECEVTVTAASIPATGITLNKSSGTLVEGQGITLTATVEPANTTDATTWATSDENVATVANGVVAAVGAGTATITATAGEQHAEFALTVQELNALTTYVGANIDAIGKLMFKNGKTAIIDDGTGAFWAYATANVSQNVGAIVRVQGTVVNYNDRGGLEINNATITSAEGSVTPSTPEQLNESEVITYINAFKQSTNNAVPHRRVSFRTGLVGGEGNFLTWTWPEGSALMETNISKGNMETGKVYDVDGYLVNFYASGGDTYLCVCVINAEEPEVAPESISLNESSLQIEIGGHGNLVATVSPNGASADITWSSSDEDVATVNQNGVVTGVAAGTATITARVSESIYAECEVTVAAPVRSLNAEFEANLTSTASVTAGFSITTDSVSQKSGYYQDGSGTTTFMVTRDSALFLSQPDEIEFTARIGSGNAMASFNNPVQVCFVDNNGDEINSTVVDVVSSNLTTSAHDYVVSIPYSENAYGVKLMHVKENGYNVRFYSFGLSYSYANSRAAVFGTETNDGNSITVSDVYMKFNASIKVSIWNHLGTISNYGVMFFKRAALNGLYLDTETPVKDAFEDGRTLTVIEKGNGNISNPDGDYYNFSARIRVSDSAKYETIVCAAPFIVVNGTYYFLDEMEYSVHSLAQYCITNGGSNLSNEALALL